MKGFILKPHEARQLAEGKPVVIWRACKPQPEFCGADGEQSDINQWGWMTDEQPSFLPVTKCCPFPVGVPLYGKETWVELLAVSPASDEPMEIGPGEKLIEPPTSYKGRDGQIRWHYDGKVIAYRANSDVEFCDGDGFTGEHADRDDMPKWRSSVHMPQWASRTTLVLSDVRVRRPCDVTGEEACNMLTEECRARAPYMETKGVLSDWHIRAFKKQFELHLGTGWGLYHWVALATPQPKEGA